MSGNSTSSTSSGQLRHPDSVPFNPALYLSRYSFLALLLALAAQHGDPSTPRARAVPPDDELIGLWGSEQSFGPRVRGPLTVTRGPHWIARIAGQVVAPEVTHDTVRFALPGGAGEFRGRLAGRGRAITGFWIQPTGVALSVRYASPVRLDSVGPGEWRGDVVPLEDRYALYLLVRRDQDGALLARFQNPEANHLGRSGWLRLERTADSLRFLDPSNPGRRVAGTLEVASHRILLRWPPLDTVLVLDPRDRDHAAGFYPRTPEEQRYRYRPPASGADGWHPVAAGRVGMDEAALGALVQRLAAADPSSDTVPLIHSVLIARHGKLVLEEYFRGFDRARLHDLRSASKTFVSVLLGAAMLNGARLSPETPVYALFAAQGPFANPDPRKAAITVGELMTHSSGLACDDNDDDSPGNEDRMQEQAAQPDWFRYVLDLPLVHQPGEVYAYCSGGMNLAGGALRAATGVWLPELFDSLVARPLQIRRYAVNLMPTGEGYSGGGMHLRPRDLLKVGVAYLNGGVWNGVRVVSRAWVERSTAFQMASGNGSSDGYGWHRNTLEAGGRTYQEYEANGNGGQLLIVLPELDLALVFTAGSYGNYRVWRKLREEIVPHQIIPAVTGP